MKYGMVLSLCTFLDYILTFTLISVTRIRNSSYTIGNGKN